MELKSLLVALEDIDDDFAPVGINALQHAAELSPYITERTIGPDLKEWDGVETNKENSLTKTSPEKVKTPLTPKTPTNVNEKGEHINSPTSPLNVSSLQNLDLETVVNSVRLRDIEEKRRHSIRKSMLGLLQKHNDIFELHNAQKQDDIHAAHEKWCKKQKLNEENINAQATSEAEQQLLNDAAQLDALAKQTQRKLQNISFHGIIHYQRRFRARYELVAKLITSHETKVEHNNKLKQFVQMFDQLITKVKNTECGIQELLVAERICKVLESFEQNLIEELRHVEEEKIIKQKQDQELQEQQKQQQQEEQQRQQEEQQKQQQLQLQQEVKQQEIKSEELKQSQPLQEQLTENVTPAEPEVAQSFQPQASAPQTTIFENACTERLKFYTYITSFYQEKVERVKPLQADDASKRFRAACQKAINIPVNAISAVSAQHLRDKFEKLYSVISGQIIKHADMQFSINDHPLGRDYCLLLMAKKFVNQGDSAVSSNPQAAFPVASIIVSLWKSVPDFGKIFLAYIFKESPFLVPYFIPQQQQQSIDDYFKVLGYRSTDGKLEPQDMYLKRQAGITRLYAAVMITGSAAQLNVAPHPYGIEHAWRWMCNFVMLEPLPDICATILVEMLYTVGCDLWTTYGKQFVKLLIYVQQQYFPRLSAVDEGGPKARLELLLNNFLKEGKIPKPQGMLHPNFW